MDSVITQLVRDPKILVAMGKLLLHIYINNTNTTRLSYEANHLEVSKCKANTVEPLLYDHPQNRIGVVV